mgnify:CR=1 FL=1
MDIILERTKRRFRPKKRGIGGLLLDLFLVFCTGVVWLVWLLIRHLRNSRC